MCVVRLSHLADVDLDGIRDYVRRQTPDAADRLLDDLFERFELLARQPLMGQSRDDLRVHLRSFSAGRYVIFYYPAPDGIHVARVLHSARDVSAIVPASMNSKKERKSSVPASMRLIAWLTPLASR